MNTLPIHELFSTFQGEGVHMGRAAFFIRLYGCPLHCSWCDSAGTWAPKYKPEHIAKLTVQELVAEAKESGAELVVITGGEPGVFDLRALTLGLRMAGFRVHVETSGAFKLRGSFEWVTVSPKVAKLPELDCILAADELKIIVDTAESIDMWREELGALLKADFHKWAARFLCGNVWLHPEWSQRENPAILNLISLSVRKFPSVYRAGWQMHKLYQVDRLDKRSAPLVPLGGDASKGY